MEIPGATAPPFQNAKSPAASNKPSCSNGSKSLDTGLDPSTELPSPTVLSVLISDRSCSTSCLSLSFASPRLECDFCRSWCLASRVPSSCSSCWTCFSLRSRKARWEARFWARRRCKCSFVSLSYWNWFLNLDGWYDGVCVRRDGWLTIRMFEIACLSSSMVDFLRRRSSYMGLVRSVNSTELRMSCCCWRYWALIMFG